MRDLDNILMKVSEYFRNSNYFCTEDNLSHTGRMSYLFFIQDYLKQEKDFNLINQLKDNYRVEYNIPFIFPGSYEEEIGFRTITIKEDKLKILDELFSDKHKKSEINKVDIELTQRFI
jgi:hypothetical protein